MNHETYDNSRNDHPSDPTFPLKFVLDTLGSLLLTDILVICFAYFRHHYRLVYVEK